MEAVPYQHDELSINTAGLRSTSHASDNIAPDCSTSTASDRLLL